MKPNKYNPNYHTGRFNKRIAIYGYVVKQDEIGNERKSLDELTTVWSMIKTLRGNESYEAAQPYALNTTRFVVRFSRSLEEIFKQHGTKLEIHYKHVIYDVKSVINDDEMNVTYTVVAEGRVKK